MSDPRDDDARGRTWPRAISNDRAGRSDTQSLPKRDLLDAVVLDVREHEGARTAAAVLILHRLLPVDGAPFRLDFSNKGRDDWGAHGLTLKEVRKAADALVDGRIAEYVVKTSKELVEPALFLTLVNTVETHGRA